MQLLKNPEFNRLLGRFAIGMLLFLALMAALSILTLSQLHRDFAAAQAAIVGTVVELYPDAEVEVIAQILDPAEKAAAAGKELLLRYGISGDELLETAALQRGYRRNLAAGLLTVVLVSGSFALLTSLFLNKQYSQIRQVTEYSRRIKNGDYSLDIRDNSEGDLSILKNEIYKITTMLREQTETLQQDKVLLADSLADISHQLKTPMTSMLMLRDLLQEAQNDEMKEDFLLRMKSQLGRMEWLVTSLLKLSRLDAGTVVMKKEEVRVGQLLSKTLEGVSVPLDIKMQHVAVEGDEHVSFTGDFSWCGEALINILKNCIEHTPEGGVIRISFARNPLYTEISIADRGSGIDPSDLPYIFNRFYKGKNSAEDSVGIGLAMAKAIVEKQGGIIDVKSELGSGTTFTIKFY